MRPPAIAVQPFGGKPYCGWSFHRPWGCLQHLPIKPRGALSSSVADFVSLQYKPWLGNLAKTPDPGLGKCQPQPAFPSITLPSPLIPNMPKLSISEAQRSKGEGNGDPLQYSCLENPMDGGAWWAAVHGVAKSQHD